MAVGERAVEDEIQHLVAAAQNWCDPLALRNQIIQIFGRLVIIRFGQQRAQHGQMVAYIVAQLHGLFGLQAQAFIAGAGKLLHRSPGSCFRTAVDQCLDRLHGNNGKRAGRIQR